MEDTFTPDRAETEPTGAGSAQTPRPDRFALWAVVMAVDRDDRRPGDWPTQAPAAAASGPVAVAAVVTTAAARRAKSRYAQIWDGYSQRNQRWARKTSECESGGDPNAIGGGGMYRGAFQFMRSTWRQLAEDPGRRPDQLQLEDPGSSPWRSRSATGGRLAGPGASA